MKAKKMLDLADACGLHTAFEAYNNIEIHALNLFDYDDIESEIRELKDALIKNKIATPKDNGVILIKDLSLEECLLLLESNEI